MRKSGKGDRPPKYLGVIVVIGDRYIYILAASFFLSVGDEASSRGYTSQSGESGVNSGKVKESGGTNASGRDPYPGIRSTNESKYINHRCTAMGMAIS